MKDIHPNYTKTEVSCGCGNQFETFSTYKQGTMKIDVCDACHPFYTGKHKIVDTAGRVEKFMAKFGRKKDKAADSKDSDK